MGLILLFTTFLVAPCSGQQIKAYAGEFLQLGVGARSLAMGGTGTASANDITAAYFNPAGLQEIQYPTIGGMHETRFDNIVQYNYGAFALPLSATASAALTVLQVNISDIKDTRNALVDLGNSGRLDQNSYLNYDKVTTFSNYDWAFLFSFAKGVNSLFSYGATAKFIYRRLDPQTTASGIGFDLGARYHYSNELTLGAAVQDITTTLISYSTGQKELVSPTVKLGAAYRWNMFENGWHHLIPTVDLDLRFEGRGSVAQIHAGPVSGDFHFGAEYQFKELFAIRAGYNDLKMFSIGAGVKLPKLSVDYAFMMFNNQDQLGNTHRISFAFVFDQAKWKR